MDTKLTLGSVMVIKEARTIGSPEWSDSEGPVVEVTGGLPVIT